MSKCNQWHIVIVLLCVAVLGLHYVPVACSARTYEEAVAEYDTVKTEIADAERSRQSVVDEFENMLNDNSSQSERDAVEARIQKMDEELQALVQKKQKIENMIAQEFETMVINQQ